MADDNDPLSDEALKPVSLSLADKIKANKEANGGDNPATVLDPGPRRRGRPPGSKNKVNTSDIDSGKLARERLAKEKAAKADIWTSRIVVDLNTELLGLFIAQGMPPTAIYKNGNAPARTTADPNLTEFGNKVAIPPHTARALGSFIADLETSERGSAIAEQMANGTVATVIKGAIAAVLVFQYTRGLATVYSELKPVMDAYKAAQAAKTQGENNA